MENYLSFEKNRIGKCVTNTVALAHLLGITHSELVGQIDDLDCPEEFKFLHFEEMWFVDKTNVPKRMYEVTRDGVSLLIMSLDSPKAAELKVHIMKEWNRRLGMINDEDAIVLEAFTILQRRVNAPINQKYLRIES